MAAQTVYNRRRDDGPCIKTCMLGRPNGEVKQENRMSIDTKFIPGIVRNGVVIPQTENQLPEGTHVEIVLQPTGMTPELKAELDGWERAGDEAWAMIDK